MDGGPRWGRGWVSLGLWLGLESLLFGCVLLAGVFLPAGLNSLRDVTIEHRDYHVTLDDGRELRAETRAEYEALVREHRGSIKTVEFKTEPRWSEVIDKAGAWLALGPHVLGLAWVVALERRRLLDRLRPSLRGAGLGVAGGIAMVLVGGGWSWLVEAAGVSPPDVASYLRGLVPSPAVLLLWGAVLVPIVEEAWFRGRLLDAVGDRLDLRWAFLFSSVLFMAVHGIPVFFPAYFAIAAILFLLRERTGGLFAPIVAHALNNAWGLLMPS